MIEMAVRDYDKVDALISDVFEVGHSVTTNHFRMQATVYKQVNSTNLNE